MKKIISLFTFILLLQFSKAQTIGVGQWEDCLSYKGGVAVAEGGGKVYSATKSGIFSLNKSDNALERMSKVSGLSDVEATVLGYNYNVNKLLIGYQNSNIDILDNTGAITNLSDIKRKSILGNKSINNVYFENEYAYLACGFGIVVINMTKLEISDTYYIGPNGTPINVRDITTDNNYIYAATDAGVYKAIKNTNLANYANWSRIAELPIGIYNTIAEFHGKIYTNFSKMLANGTYAADTAYKYDNNVWSYFLPPAPVGYTINALKNHNSNSFSVTMPYAVTIYDSTLNIKDTLYGYFFDYKSAVLTTVDMDDYMWLVGSVQGLIRYKKGTYLSEFAPDGPNSPNVVAMDVKDNYLMVAPGGGANGYFTDGIYSYKQENGWKHISGTFPSVVSFDSISNINNVLIDPNDTKRAYATTGYVGVLELYDNVPVKLYNSSNSSLQRLTTPGYNPIWTSGLAFDEAANLWVANSGVALSMSVKKNDGTWQALNFSNIIGSAPNLGQIIVDRNNQKWVVLTRGGGLMVYNGTGEAPNSSNTKKLTSAIGNGALPSLNVFCLAEDTDGEIWVGTDKGVTIFYSPENVFSGEDFDAQQILIEQDGHVQILLETELIQSIAIDGANRKWIGTLNSGVFLMSPDGLTQIYHFDITNSPLFSNNVQNISINQKTGEVYFGTSKGIIGFRGTATGGGDFFSDVYSFPNPVKHDYTGPIAIKGLVTNSIVKITDISGSLVFETVSEGGQAIWHGKNFNGERVSTGVYLVFCASQDGSQKLATKILFIN